MMKMMKGIVCHTGLKTNHKQRTDISINIKVQKPGGVHKISRITCESYGIGKVALSHRLQITKDLQTNLNPDDT